MRSSTVNNVNNNVKFSAMACEINRRSKGLFVVNQWYIAPLAQPKF
ncbi:Uncharacterised protein [Moraxella atlantae]|uniref:Uncharacterized protein n=1 Tax=Faucicola atlantae TaxID=34059 RepID=A0A378Q3L8_9GAMM|nr:Uncharacterised protein [Moraxella atlantae]